MAGTRLSDITSLTLLGISEIFNSAAKADRELYYKNSSREVKMDLRIGTYQTLGALAAAETKVEGAPVKFNKIETDYQTSIYNYTRSNGVECTLEADAYDQYDIVQSTFGQPLIDTMIDLKEQTVADVYNHAFASTGGDGVYQIAANHPLHNAIGVYNDNLVTGELSVENIKIAKNKFNHIKNQAGRRFPTHATHILAHEDKSFALVELLQSSLMAWEISNTKNSLQSKDFSKIIYNNYLDYDIDTDKSPWFLLDKTLKAGVVLQVKQALKLHTFYDDKTLDYCGLAYEMYGAGMTASGYGIVGSEG